MKIVIRGTNWIGDAVMSVPAIKRLRTAFPEAEITLLTREWAEGIFRDADFIDRIITLDSARSPARSVAQQASMLRPEKFDLAVILPNSFESALAGRLSGAKRVFGYATDGRGFMLTDRVAVPEWKNRRHEVFYYLNLVEAVEAAFGRATSKDLPPAPSILISAERKAAARELLAGSGADLSKPVVAIAAGSKNSRAKRWGTAKFSEFADALVAGKGANVVLIGAPDEAEVSEAVRDSSKSTLIDLTGKTDLSVAAAMLAEADVLVANDMGLAHLAPAVGTPSITIFGPTDPATTRPFDEGSAIIRVDVECSPCMLRDCPIDHRCMTRISVDSVVAKALEILETHDRND